MADLVSLMAYLQHGPPSLPIIEPEQSPQNTHNDGYSADDIETVGHWQGFSLASILQQYGGLLATVQITDEPFQPSPPRPINSERALRSRIDAYLTNRIIRALRQGFTYMSSTRPLAGFFTVLTYDVGAMAATFDDDPPRFAFFDPSLDAQTRPNRVPGCAKPSYE
ncbi:hypothetical protein AbraIFM66950_006542 [Aspergillus brasiliensis]|nr:hypothetical protein AbraIFM66950_006542 [Aspergillus brasiliensis]